MSWYASSWQHMAAVLEESQAAGVADVGRAIDDSCPYSSRSGFAYKSWLEARRDFFRKHNIPLLILIVNGTRNCAQQEVKMSEQVKRYSFGEFAEKHTHPVGPGSYVKASDYDALHDDYAALEAECERLRAQVSALQSDANSWQSGYDKGREDGAKAADGWKAQHARDSAELRRLCAERDALAAELARWERSRRGVHEPALREAHAYIQDLRAELEAARGLLREMDEYLSRRGDGESIHTGSKFHMAIDAFLTATTAPEVPNHTEQHLEMAEQGERQEASQDVRALAAALYQACGAYDMPDRVLDALSAAANGEPFAHMIGGLLPCVPPSDQDVRALVEALENCAAALAWNCFGECRAVHAGPIIPAAMALDTARAALAAHRQAQRQ